MRLRPLSSFCDRCPLRRNKRSRQESTVMPRTSLSAIILAAFVFAAFPLAVCAGPAESRASVSVQDLRRNFANPPASARPMVRWWWFGAAVEKPEILRELQQMKSDPDAVPVATRAFARTDHLLIRAPVYGPGDHRPCRWSRTQASTPPGPRLRRMTGRW